MEVLLSVGDIVIIIASVQETVVIWERSIGITNGYHVLYVTIGNLFVFTVIDGHWILMCDVKPRRVLIEEEATG